MKKSLNQVIDFIYDNLESTPTLKQIAQFAGLSEGYFHRQFQSRYGISVDALQRVLRLRRAAWQLAYRTSKPVTDIAFDAGYDSVAAFSKAFRRHGGMTPSSFRQSPDWKYWESLAQPLSVLVSHEQKSGNKEEDICWQRVRLDEIKLSGFYHRADAASLGNTLRQFIDWRKTQKVSPARSKTFNVYLSAPTPQRLALFVGATNPADKPLAKGMCHYLIPAMDCLVMSFTGSDNTMGSALSELVSAAGGCDCHPPFVERIRWFPDVPEHLSEFTLYAPVALT